MGVNDLPTPIDHKNHMNGLEMDLMFLISEHY